MILQRFLRLELLSTHHAIPILLFPLQTLQQLRNALPNRLLLLQRIRLLLQLPSHRLLLLFYDETPQRFAMISHPVEFGLRRTAASSAGSNHIATEFLFEHPRNSLPAAKFRSLPPPPPANNRSRKHAGETTRRHTRSPRRSCRDALLSALSDTAPWTRPLPTIEFESNSLPRTTPTRAAPSNSAPHPPEWILPCSEPRGCTQPA